MSNIREVELTAVDENELYTQRKSKLAQLREEGFNYPNTFKPDHVAACIHSLYESWTHDKLEAEPHRVKIAGRIMLRRLMGKASFVHIKDTSGQVQLYVRQNDVSDATYEAFKAWDIGDIVGVVGVVFKTKTGELSIKVETIELLTKNLRPLPDKWHGLADQELCYRQRYVDLIINDETRRCFKTRIELIQGIRQFLVERKFLEVETPMMHSIPGGAAARPFKTHHNALDMELFLRIAPELYLKRLVVGGFERVFEINRNFRNEGLSTRHNPEFTMLEFYQAYSDYNDLMDLTEKMLRKLAQDILGTLQIPYQNYVFNFEKPFARMTVKESIIHFNPQFNTEHLESHESVVKILEGLDVQPEAAWGLGRLQMEIFDRIVEPKLIDPTFITAYPTEISPLARRNDKDESVTDRFEFFIGGREIANGFSELNDPEDQAQRFMEQVSAKEAGDQEAMHYDADYINALEYGLPPTAGEGIGIDRLAMIFTNSASIRDVILFPHLRKI